MEMTTPVTESTALLMQRAAIALLTDQGFVVLSPQDQSWGVCAGNTDVDGGPHQVSTSLCVWCLEYDPS